MWGSNEANWADPRALTTGARVWGSRKENWEKEADISRQNVIQNNMVWDPGSKSGSSGSEEELREVLPDDLRHPRNVGRGGPSRLGQGSVIGMDQGSQIPQSSTQYMSLGGPCLDTEAITDFDMPTQSVSGEIWDRGQFRTDFIDVQVQEEIQSLENVAPRREVRRVIPDPPGSYFEFSDANSDFEGATELNNIQTPYFSRVATVATKDRAAQQGGARPAAEAHSREPSALLSKYIESAKRKRESDEQYAQQENAVATLGSGVEHLKERMAMLSLHISEKQDLEEGNKCFAQRSPTRQRRSSTRRPDDSDSGTDNPENFLDRTPSRRKRGKMEAPLLSKKKSPAIQAITDMMLDMKQQIDLLKTPPFKGALDHCIGQTEPLSNISQKSPASQANLLSPDFQAMSAVLLDLKQQLAVLKTSPSQGIHENAKPEIVVPIQVETQISPDLQALNTLMLQLKQQIETIKSARSREGKAIAELRDVTPTQTVVQTSSDLHALNAKIADLTEQIMILKTPSGASNKLLNKVHLEHLALEPQHGARPKVADTVTGVVSCSNVPRMNEKKGVRRDFIKLDKYDGSTPLETFLINLETCAEYNEWSDIERLAQLKASLKGDAAQVLLSDEGPLTFENLCNDLKSNFGTQGFESQYENTLRTRRRKRG